MLKAASQVLFLRRYKILHFRTLYQCCSWHEHRVPLRHINVPSLSVYSPDFAFLLCEILHVFQTYSPLPGPLLVSRYVRPPFECASAQVNGIEAWFPGAGWLSVYNKQKFHSTKGQSCSSCRIWPFLLRLEWSYTTTMAKWNYVLYPYYWDSKRPGSR